jgi:hypothetical protein
MAVKLSASLFVRVAQPRGAMSGPSACSRSPWRR